MAAIELDGISKRFPDGTEALQRTDLRIDDGEFFILVGPSGCGKSTLLNIVAGLTAPSTGEVRVGGEPVTGRDPGQRNLAMVFQSYAIYPHMTVRENIAFPLRIAKLDPAEIAARVAQVASILELRDLLDRRPAELSGGQRQRVAMGRAIVRRPAAFLLDEPLSNLDARLRVQMRAELARLQQRLGTTTIYVTHDQTEAMTLGQRAAVLWQGRVQQVGTPRDLYERPANLFVAGFVGSPAMNFLPARIAGGRLVLPMGEIPLPEGLRGLTGGEPRDVLAGIRPEQIRAAESGDGPGMFSAAVEMVEWLGADQYVHIDLEEEAAGRFEALPAGAEITPLQDARLHLVARTDAGRRVAAGDVLRLCIGEGVSLFDPRSGMRITRE